jgi:outer membrane protein assembly factor BamB
MIEVKNVSINVRIQRSVLLLSIVFLSGQAAPAAEPGETWPQWRGPNRDGFTEGPAWPDSLAEDRLTLKWRVELGPGYPGPIVTKDRVFVAETENEKTEIVRALDRATGKELWRASWPGAMSVPFMAKRNGDWIRSTPAYDGESLYVAGMRDVLVCLDAKSGEERWRVDFVEKFKTPLPAFGCVCAPLVVGEHVYMQAGAGFCKVNKRTGEVVWRVLVDAGGMFGSAFSSPVYAPILGKDQLIVQTRQKMAGVDAESGEALWSMDIPAMLGMNILTPVVAGDAVFTSSYGGGSRLLKFERVDGKIEPGVAWKAPLQGYMSNPIVIDGHAYLHMRNQRFTCVDLVNGKQKWTTTPYGEYWSLVARGDKILALDQRGDLLLIRATPKKFDLLDSRKISDQETWGHVGVAGDEIFVRELKGISAYRWR